MQPDTTTGEIPKLSRWQRHRRAILILVALLVIGLAAMVAWFLLGQTKEVGDSQIAPAVQSTAPSITPAAQQAPPTTWKGSVDPTALPLGDGHVSTTPQAGSIESCTTNFRGGGAQHTGNWIDQHKGTWNSQTKVTVSGSVAWSDASYSESITGDKRVLTTNDLPKCDPTGLFPIRSNDPAYQFDRNPNSILAHTFTYTLPLSPAAAPTPSCLGLGPIGIMSNGILLYNGLDDGGRDAVAHETQDACDGHPDGQERYHYHDVAACIQKRATCSATLVGYAIDGYGIYVERDAKGNLPTDADLDACHGRTSNVMWDGKLTNIYHYDATLEYPYTLGCYHGTPLTTR